MELSKFVVTDDGVINIYPNNLTLAVMTFLSLTGFVILLVLPIPAGMVTYTLALIGTLFFGIISFGLGREFWNKKPIITITKVAITIRAIPFWRPETIAWSDIDDIGLVKNYRHNFLVVYGKPGSAKHASLWQRCLLPIDSLKRKGQYINAIFLPCSTETLLLFLATMILKSQERKNEKTKIGHF